MRVLANKAARVMTAPVLWNESLYKESLKVGVMEFDGTVSCPFIMMTWDMALIIQAAMSLSCLWSVSTCRKALGRWYPRYQGTLQGSSIASLPHTSHSTFPQHSVYEYHSCQQEDCHHCFNSCKSVHHSVNIVITVLFIDSLELLSPLHLYSSSQPWVYWAF